MPELPGLPTPPNDDSPGDDLALTGAATIDQAHFRSVLGHFCSGIAVVTTIDDDRPAGFTCQAFSSVSLDPPLVAFFPSRTSSSYPHVRSAGRFCVNVLREDQEELCRVFSQSGTDRFKGMGWRPAPSGSPILEDALAWIDCRIVAEHEGETT